MTEKTYDIERIAEVVKIPQRSFAWREIILAGVALLLLVVCLVLAGLYGHERGNMPECKASTGTSLVVNNQTSSSSCVSQSCLETSVRTLDLMNTSVDPCEDFYQFACGNYKNVKSASSGEGSRSILGDIHLNNQDKLMDALKKPVVRAHDQSAERKLKEFFQSCNDDYSRQQLLGTPFLEKVVPTLGGWDLLGTWSEQDWDFNAALKKVQSDFSTNAIYSLSIERSWDDPTQNQIQLQPAGTGKWMQWDWYLNSHTQNYRDDYRKFIRKVGSLLMRDANVATDSNTQQAKLEQFVDDAFTMETNIAQLAVNSDDVYMQLSLRYLNTITNDVVNWIDQISYLLSEATVTGSTSVLLKFNDYFRGIPTMISSLPDSDRKRILHNYLIWRVAEIYVQDMSWEYVHASGDIYADVHGESQSSGLYRYCFDQMETYMPDALGALFIANHFSDTNRQHVTDITNHMMTVLQDQLDRTPWMDAETKAYAKDKLNASSLKLGYPDWMADQEVVDSIYDGLEVNVWDFFGNVLSANGFLRSLWSRMLMGEEDREDWHEGILRALTTIIYSSNEIIVPAGILQIPFYDYTQPHYKNFGSLGGALGRLLHSLIDDVGKHYAKDGTYLRQDSWWTDESIENYEPVKNCVADAYRNATFNITYPDGQQRVVGIDPVEYASFAIAVTNGIRLAWKGYRKWMSERVIDEKMLPGIHLTDDQMVFLSFTQSVCFQRSAAESLSIATSGYLEEDVQVNIAMSQLTEFSETFKCPETAKMNAAKKCDYY